MPCVLITPEAILHVEGRHTDILKEAGFQIAFPKNSEFTRGLCNEEESVDELSVADALIARPTRRIFLWACTTRHRGREANENLAPCSDHVRR